MNAITMSRGHASRSYSSGTGFTCDLVVTGLWQGDFPVAGLDWKRFDDVVSLTAEAVPSVRLDVGGIWIHLPIHDDGMDHPDGVRAAARLVADRIAVGRRVLVHCAAGLNRSGVVVARALMYRGFTASEAIRLVREARGPYALGNPYFVAWLHAEEHSPRLAPPAELDGPSAEGIGGSTRAMLADTGCDGTMDVPTGA